MFLKYYFALDGDRIHINSVPCREGEEPVKPQGFIKWYEVGDLIFEPLSKDVRTKILASADSPVFEGLWSSTYRISGELKKLLRTL